MTNNGGAVSITNQFRPNADLTTDAVADQPPGSIVVGSINTSGMDSSSFTGPGGDISLSAGGDIATGNLDSNSNSGLEEFSDSDWGGDISLSAGGDIATGNLNSFSFSSDGVSEPGGDISLC